MNVQEETNFSRIAAAISYLSNNYQRQPGLDEVAAHINLSPFHFQRLFTEWAGVSPKKFLQYLTVEHAKAILKERQATLFDTAYETGLSGTGRLHDLFINIEGMTPGEYKNGGENLLITYNFSECPFGNVLIASTEKGICHVEFTAGEVDAFSTLKNRFPRAIYSSGTNSLQRSVMDILNHNWAVAAPVNLHLKGTGFQLKVWETLLKVPLGHLTTYGKIAGDIGLPRASRAVGTAIGANPVAFLIPCHRVIQSTGILGQYRWGSDRKKILVGWEAARTAQHEQQ